MKKQKVLALSALLFPVVASAQPYDISTLDGIVVAVSGILNTIFPALVALAVFIVVWSIFSFIINAGDPEKRKEGVKRIFWSIIGVFLLYSVWGLINILRNTIQFEDNTPITEPNIFTSE